MTSQDPYRPQPTPEGSSHPDTFGPDAEPTYVAEPHPGWAPPAQWNGSYGYPNAQYGQYGHYNHTAQYGGYTQQYPPPQGYGQYYGYGAPYPPAAPSPSLGRRALIGVGSAALAVGLVLSGVAIAHSTNGSSDSATQLPGGSAGGSVGGNSDPNSVPNVPGAGNGSGTSTSAAVANATQQKGIVTIVSVLGYDHAESAGTGMIMTSDGEVLTNNHVISGATSVTVTVESTDRSYRADVVGTVPTKDVAVLKLRNASGLTTAKLGDAADVQDLGVGDAVTGVGNAGGTGTLRAASGKVTALGQNITASDESGGDSEKLTGLIQIDAGIVSGDSGGPLYDKDGDIVGMDTAASANSRQAAAYAIPIDSALALADKIESGAETATVHIGPPAFIGVTVTKSTSGGAQIYSVIGGGPADKAGITSGSRITAVGGTAVANATALKPALQKYQPGDSISITWIDPGGTSHKSTVTAIAGPAD